MQRQRRQIDLKWSCDRIRSTGLMRDIPHDDARAFVSSISAIGAFLGFGMQDVMSGCDRGSNFFLKLSR
jgi:hypothetical protein